MTAVGWRRTGFATGAGLALAVISGLAAWSGTRSPELQQVSAVVEGFYAAYSTFHPSDGIPSAKERVKLEPFISPSLDRLLIEGEAAERHFAVATRHMSPPLIEGDLFTSNFEGATAVDVGACQFHAGAAQCAVALGYRGGPKDANPVSWTDTVYLVHMKDGWRVDDIAYGATWAFGNKGRLKETLQTAIRDGNDAAR